VSQVALSHDGVLCVVLVVVFPQSHQRRRSASAAGLPGAPAGPVSAGSVYLVRLVGSVFSFYSVDVSTQFLDLFENYKSSDNDPPQTCVYKCEFKFAGREEADTEFDFKLPEHRKLIIMMLDAIRSIIIR